MKFIFEQLRTAGDRNFAYVIGDRSARVGALVDPSYDPDAVCDRARVQGLKVEYIFNTHGHSDHTNGNVKAKRLCGARLAAFRGSPVKPDVPLEDGQRLSIGELVLDIFHVPGHCDDHVLLYLAEQKVAITGDLLFVGKIGGTETDAEARVEYDSLRRVLSLLPDDVTIWPGHDYGCRPSSTVALEMATNPFLRVNSFDEFLALKKNWAYYKAEHGLK